jgi:hypothetical protein
MLQGDDVNMDSEQFLDSEAVTSKKSDKAKVNKSPFFTEEGENGHRSVVNIAATDGTLDLLRVALCRWSARSARHQPRRDRRRRQSDLGCWSLVAASHTR